MLFSVVRKETGMFIKILTKTYKGEKRYYASLVENKRIDGKAVQTVKTKDRLQKENFTGTKNQSF